VTEDWNEYRLTEDEFATILDALRHAQDDAVHSDGKAKFSQVQSELVTQHDHHARDKRTTSERFEDDVLITPMPTVIEMEKTPKQMQREIDHLVRDIEAKRALQDWDGPSIGGWMEL